MTGDTFDTVVAALRRSETLKSYIDLVRATGGDPFAIKAVRLSPVLIFKASPESLRDWATDTTDVFTSNPTPENSSLSDLVVRYMSIRSRENADFGDLRDMATFDTDAFDALCLLSGTDLERTGGPNPDLRAWAADVLLRRVQRPKRRKAGQRMETWWRDKLLLILVQLAVDLGLAPTRRRNAISDAPRSAGEAVIAAMSAGGLPVPNLATLEGIWLRHRPQSSHDEIGPSVKPS